MSDLLVEVRNGAGLITLNRPKALNALSLGMVRDMTAVLLAWQADPAVRCVAVRGQGKEGPFGAFCAGGDIRFFHHAALAGDASLDDFFTEEYTLDHLIHTYPKPFVAFMDGIVMGGGMGIGQGASLRIVTERTKMAMPETNIGLFPDVGGGYFLARTPGRTGEYLALTGAIVGGPQAVAIGLADTCVSAGQLPALWDAVGPQGLQDVAADAGAQGAAAWPNATQINHFFALGNATQIVQALEGDNSPWARETAAVLRQRSPLMLHVVLEQIRRGRALGLADDLRMERGMVRQCFQLRPGAASETVEGIRALAVDKDHAPKWSPARLEDVTPEMVAPFFASPWPAHAHPLRHLA